MGWHTLCVAYTLRYKRDAWDRIPCLSLASSWTQVVHLLSFTMINSISTLVNAITKGAKLVQRSSSCAHWILADVIGGTCVVQYANGSAYEYTNVSRRALFNLINNKDVSLGFFINQNLLFCDSKAAKYGVTRQVLAY